MKITSGGGEDDRISRRWWKEQLLAIAWAHAGPYIISVTDFMKIFCEYLQNLEDRSAGGFAA